jgi:hypothetical protein
MTDQLLPKKEAKKPYISPRLVCHGDVRCLTQAGTGVNKEFLMILRTWRV